MNRFKRAYSIYFAIMCLVFGLASQASGQLYRNTTEIRDITRQLKNQVDNFQLNLSNQLRRRSSIGRADQDKLISDVSAFKLKVSDFETRFERQYETADDVKAVLSAASGVNDFIGSNSISTNIDRDWSAIRGLLDRLASNYNVYWDWNDDSNSGNYPTSGVPTSGGNYAYSLTGTYKLDEARSEDTEEIADRAIRRSNSQNKDADREDLEDKLDAPIQMAVDVRGNKVTIAASNSQPVTFVADGRETTQSTDDGRTVRVRASLRGQELLVSSLGGNSDYTITFTSTEQGRSMKVMRRITTQYLTQTVFAESVYQKTDSVARLGSYNSGDINDNGGYSTNDPNDRNYPDNSPTVSTARTGNYIVPNDAILFGTLENDIDTKVSQNDDRFRMTVRSPDVFRGAVIEGYLSGIDRSGRITGRSEITFNFRTIRMPNGQTYDFAGFLQSVTDENGKTIKIDDEGTAKGDSQTKETVKRSGIGAGIGALIGVIAGGAKGAAIGAVIGGGAGAGSVILQGKDDLKLRAGSEMSVKSSSNLR